ncbi:hypothetical protein BJP26_14035 [Sphingomonas melonis TY]|nr:hypothetical protein BJP26_14035 [Sphingomonas melonis TY]
MPLDQLWATLEERPGPVAAAPNAAVLEALVPGETQRLRMRADDAIAHRVDLLGSGPVDLGAKIDWHRDFKSGLRFEPAFCRSIAYNDLNRPNDVKVPWELSRMQWLIPAGQHYQLTGDDCYARAIRDTIDDWITENPYAFSVNWACTMDVALRAIAWVWFFHACHASLAWRDANFRGRFLVALYMHGDFIARQLEKADVNGNHYTADAAGLVFVGLFFAGSARAMLGQRRAGQFCRVRLRFRYIPTGSISKVQCRIIGWFRSYSCIRLCIVSVAGSPSIPPMPSDWQRWRDSPRVIHGATDPCRYGAMPTTRVRCRSAMMRSTIIAI